MIRVCLALIAAILALFLLAVLVSLPFALRVNAEESKVWRNMIEPPAHVTLGPPQVPNAVATVVFHDTMVHNSSEEFTLTHDDMVMSFGLQWQPEGSAAERLTIYPPDGFVSVPRQLQPGENSSGVAHIYRFEGM